MNEVDEFEIGGLTPEQIKQMEQVAALEKAELDRLYGGPKNPMNTGEK